MKDFLIRIKSLFDGSGAGQARRHLAGLQDAARQTGSLLDRAGRIGSAALFRVAVAAQAAWGAITGAASAVAAFFGGAMRAAGGAQALQTSFAALLGDAGKASGLLNRLRDNATATGVSFEAQADNIRKFIALGFDPAQAEALNRSLLDIAGAVGLSNEEVKLLAVGLAQIQAKGVAGMEELRGQIAERGIPIFEALSEKLGVTTAELQKMVAQGRVSADDVISVFTNLDGPLSKFRGSAQRMAGTWQGLTRILGEQGARTLKELGDALMPVATLLGGAFLAALKAAELALRAWNAAASAAAETMKVIAAGLGLIPWSWTAQGAEDASAGMTSLGSAASAARDKIEDLTAAAKRLGDGWLDAATAQAAQLNQQLEKSLSTLQAMNRQAEEIAAAELDLELARVTARERAGEITKPQADAERARLRAAASDAALKRQLAALDAEAARIDDTLAQAAAASAERAAAIRAAEARQQEWQRLSIEESQLIARRDDLRARNASFSLTQAEALNYDKLTGAIQSRLGAIAERRAALGVGADTTPAGRETAARALAETTAKLREQAEAAAQAAGASLAPLRERREAIESERAHLQRLHAIRSQIADLNASSAGGSELPSLMEQLRLAEARASGDTAAIRAIETAQTLRRWQAEFAAAGAADPAQLARRMAAALSAGSAPPERRAVSALHAVGAARGEIGRVADAQLSELRRANRTLSRIAEKDPLRLDPTARFAA